LIPLETNKIGYSDDLGTLYTSNIMFLANTLFEVVKIDSVLFHNVNIQLRS